MRAQLLIILLTTLIIASCNPSTNDQEQKGIVIPFKLTDHNNISISAVLNEKDTVELMFHTAAGDLSLTEQASQRIQSINWQGEHDVNTWGGNAEARFSQNNRLGIGDLTWDSLVIWESMNSGPGTDGKFGPNFFEHKAIEIDYQSSVITLYDSLPMSMKGFSKMPLKLDNGMMFIEGVSIINDQNYSNQFLIHSGYGGEILYDDAFAAESNIGEQIEITDEQVLKDSYGNSIKTLKGNLPTIKFSDIAIDDVTVGFFEGSIGRQKMSVLGGGMLKRFHLIIDSKREFIYLAPVDAIS